MTQTQEIKINEIFHSIQGESSLAGQRTTFIRTSGCHLRCTYCDTAHAYYEGRKMTIAEILTEVRSHETQFVCVTGGEPLLQPLVISLLKELCDAGYTVSLETSGDRDCSAVDERVRKIIDVKTPDSGEANRFCMDNLRFANKETEFKFVISSEKDFEWSEEFCRKYKLFEKSNVLYSPSFIAVSPQWLAEKILQSRSLARLQLQIHKYIWSPDRRGV